MTEYTAFFYGTLMHPKILTRVLKNDGSHLLIAHAVLYEYTRYKVKYAAFPGITPTNQDINLNDDSTYNHEQHSVEGTLVIGLTESDMEMLDEFEGSQYERKTVQAHPLSPFIPPSRHQLLATPGESKKQLAVEAETYVYREVDHLEHEPWSFEEFLEKNAWMWFDERRLVAFSETSK
ncbi:AIG2-like family-domain-containing protein, partial [Flagelloscypha sp. PMI_526]